MSYLDCNSNITCDDFLTTEQRKDATLVKIGDNCYAYRVVTDISIATDEINLSVDGLEALVAATNTALTDGSQRVKILPPDSAATCFSEDMVGTARASNVTKASAGVLKGITAYNTHSSDLYLLVFNSTTLPIDGTAPSLPPIPVAKSGFVQIEWDAGKWMSTGITWCMSTTPTVKTISGSYGIINVSYK